MKFFIMDIILTHIEDSKNMGQNQESHHLQHDNGPHLAAGLQVDDALVVKSILFGHFCPNTNCTTY